MADEHQDPMSRRFLKRLQQCIGGVDVHIVNGVDDRDPMGRTGRRFREELRKAPHLIDGNDLAGLAVLAQALQHE